mgnify:CR=1 FL=1
MKIKSQNFFIFTKIKFSFEANLLTLFISKLNSTLVNGSLYKAAEYRNIWLAGFDQVILVMLVDFKSSNLELEILG